MPSAINTNVSSLIAQNAITSNSLSQSKAMQQLSTGLRINGAKDDAAGLAIASKMTSQIKGLDQSVRNANDAISMLQTADGALVAVGDMMQRMREIAVQGASDTNVSSDRTALNSEFSQLKLEIGRVVKSTQWNGMNILDGSANGSTGSFNFQVGAAAGQTVNQTIGNMGFATGGGSTGTNAATTAAAAAVKQVDTITIGGTPAAGDVLTFTMNKAQFQYTVQASDISGTAATDQATIAGKVATAMGVANGSQPSFASANSLVATSSTTTVILTAAAINVASTSPTITTSSGGSLANINDLTVSNQVSATTSIASMDTAIATVNGTRSDLGAKINRLTYAADNLANVSQNAQASRSRIQDTDYAKTSTELARTQIIAQAATAMLAQANQSQQSVLALLK
jgi:flagellin